MILYMKGKLKTQRDEGTCPGLNNQQVRVNTSLLDWAKGPDTRASPGVVMEEAGERGCSGPVSG